MLYLHYIIFPLDSQLQIANQRGQRLQFAQQKSGTGHLHLCQSFVRLLHPEFRKTSAVDPSPRADLVVKNVVQQPDLAYGWSSSKNGDISPSLWGPISQFLGVLEQLLYRFITQLISLQYLFFLGTCLSIIVGLYMKSHQKIKISTVLNPTVVSRSALYHGTSSRRCPSAPNAAPTRDPGWRHWSVPWMAIVLYLPNMSKWLRLQEMMFLISWVHVQA